MSKRIYMKNENIIHEPEDRKYVLNLYKHHRKEKLKSLLSPEFYQELKERGHHLYMKDVYVIFDDNHSNWEKGNYGFAYCEEKLIFVSYMLQCFEKSLDFIIKHEYMHLVDFFENNQIGHGKSWKDLMKSYELHHMAKFDCEKLFPEDYININ